MQISSSQGPRCGHAVHGSFQPRRRQASWLVRKYDDSVLHHHVSNHRLLVCLECQSLGYSTHATCGLRSHWCAAGHCRGHLAFKPQLLANVETRIHTPSKNLICLNCEAKPKYECCMQSCRSNTKYEWEFSEDMVRQYKKRKGRGNMICQHCEVLGFSARQGGQQVYKCTFCWRELGRQMFDGSLRRKTCGARIAQTVSQNDRDTCHRLEI